MKKDTLAAFGERKVVRDILPKFVRDVGDDCSLISSPGGNLVLTTDPVPAPAALLIGKDPDLYWMGTLLVTINASDLAAAGAQPIAFVAAIDAPADLEIESFERLLLGIRDACDFEGLEYVGGNLREAAKLTAVGTALGFSEHPLRRRGAKIGDLVVSIGAGGVFWADALRMLNGAEIQNKDKSPLFRPHSQIKAMRALNEQSLVSAAIDNSDGLLPSLELLAEASDVEIEIRLDDFKSPPGCTDLGVEPERLWLGWGDWNIIACVAEDKFARASEVVERQGSQVSMLGTVVGNKSRVLLSRQGRSAIAPRLESERFALDSWFSEGLQGYVKRLLSLPLP